MSSFKILFERVISSSVHCVLTGLLPRVSFDGISTFRSFEGSMGASKCCTCSASLSSSWIDDMTLSTTSLKPAAVNDSSMSLGCAALASLQSRPHASKRSLCFWKLPWRATSSGSSSAFEAVVTLSQDVFVSVYSFVRRRWRKPPPPPCRRTDILAITEGIDKKDRYSIEH